MSPELFDQIDEWSKNVTAEARAFESQARAGDRRKKWQVEKALRDALSKLTVLRVICVKVKDRA